MPLSTGQILNSRYRIVKLLGQGGFGAVYRAWDLNLNAPCALKESLNTSPEAVRQFTLEARLLANLRHVSLPTVIDHFTVEGQGQYLAMDYVEGEDMQQMLQRQGGPLAEAQALDWISQVCDTLTYLHSQNPPIIHRDVKPANIKITPQGQVKLVDFGIAKQYHPSEKTTLGARAVTPGFSPPEQYGKGVTDPRTDVYALGATLYAVLTCQAPVESLEREMSHPLPAPRQINPSMTPAVEAAILKAMQLAPDQRFQSAADLKAALNASNPLSHAIPVQVVQPYGSADPPLSTSTPLNQRRKNVNLIAGAVIALGLVCVLGIGLLLWKGPSFFGDLFINNGASGSSSGLLATRTRRPTATFVDATAALLSLTPTLDLGINLTETPGPTLTPFPTNPATPTYVSTNTPAPTPEPQGTWQPCPGLYPSQLRVGIRASVSFHPNQSNRVRRQPDDHAAILGMIDPGEEVDILDGPVCQGSYVWWKVRSLSTGLTGWTAEGDGRDYWLIPVQ